MDKTALILVDIQNDYFPNGRMELHETEKAAANARKVLEYFRHKDLPLFHIQHVFIDPNAPFFVAGTEGVEINESVRPLKDEMVIQKNHPNSFRETELLHYLKKANIQHVVVCGMMSHMCIDATVRASVDFGFECTVIEDACTSPDLTVRGRTIPAPDVHDSFMAALGGLYATVKTAESFLQKVEN